MNRLRRRSAQPMLPPDEALVERVRGGDVAAYEVLMRRHNQRVFRTARAVLGHDEEAEEVAQDAWVSAWQHLGDFEGRARFSTWLLRITVRKAIARLRRRARLLRFPLSGSGGEPEDREHAGPQEAASRAELRAAIESAVDRLPPSLRSVFVLREVEGLDTREAAAALGINESAAKVRLHRARCALREDLQRRIGDELRGVYAFAGQRCDRIVSAVLARLPVDGSV